jgi:hypothetical protein
LVLAVIEDEVGARFDELGKRILFGVTTEARPRVVRFRVTGNAGFVVGDMEGLAVVLVDADVALGAGHARDHVLAVREWLRSGLGEAEHPDGCPSARPKLPRRRPRSSLRETS